MEDISLGKDENNAENEHWHDKTSQGLLKKLQVKRRRSYSTSSHSGFLSRSSSNEARKT